MATKKDQYRIAVLGAGSWGITLSNLLYENNNKITLWEFDPRQAAKLERNRSFFALKDFRIPEEINITDSLEEATYSSDYIVVSVPSSVINSVAGNLSKLKINTSTTIISTIKGFEQKSLKRPSEILRDYLGMNIHIAVLSGPSHAEEVIKRIPTAVVIASVNENINIELQKLFSNLYFRTYTSFDIKGVELGGALKNIIAIASGTASGLKMGDNTKAALITRGNAEITRLGVVLGAKRDTFNGLSGIGDLIVTCFSQYSRNFRFGKYIGEGDSFNEALQKVKTTVEGVYTTKSCYKLAKKLKVQMPVCNIVYEMLYKGKPADTAWKELMLRPLKSENIEF